MLPLFICILTLIRQNCSTLHSINRVSEIPESFEDAIADRWQTTAKLGHFLNYYFVCLLVSLVGFCCFFVCMSLIFVHCYFSANPPPEIIWLHNGKEIQETEDFHFEKKGNEYSLYIQEVFPEDTGKYTCEAWNELGETQTQATLTVQGIMFFSTLGNAKRK